jgi:hypothetical protein
LHVHVATVNHDSNEACQHYKRNGEQGKDLGMFATWLGPELDRAHSM